MSSLLGIWDVFLEFAKLEFPLDLTLQAFANDERQCHLFCNCFLAEIMLLLLGSRKAGMLAKGQEGEGIQAMIGDIYKKHMVC